MKVLKVVFSLALTLGLAACDSDSSKSPHGDNTTAPGTKWVDTNAIFAKAQSLDVSSSDMAEQLALAGEQLVTPWSFMYADLVFDQALSIDAQNKRAQFYKTFVAPAMALKGVLSKVRPYIENQGGEILQEYNDFINNSLPNSGLRTFLLDGQPSIENEKDIQDFLVEFLEAQEKFRRFVMSNKDLRLTLNMNTINLREASLRKIAEECLAKNVADGIYSLSNCSYVSAFQVKVERADLEVLQHMAAGLQIYTILATAYDATGTLQLAKVSEHRKLSDKEIVTYLSRIEEFGKLRPDHALSRIPEFGSDALAGAKWAYRMQLYLCPAGAASYQNRPGFLVDKGVCIADRSSDGVTVEDVFKTIEIALSGQVIEYVGHDRIGNEVKAEINVTAPFLSPATDLRGVLPTQFNECGKASNVNDDTLMGAFPNSDANQFLTAMGQLNNDCRLSSPWR